jgi:hypothetical protein
LWRPWPKKNDRHLASPPSLYETSCISHCLKQNGITIPDNQWLFYESCDSRGAFFTWLYRADSLRKWLLKQRTHGQAFCYSAWRPVDDVSAAVNASAIRYLGDTPGTRRAIQYLNQIIQEGSEYQGLADSALRFSLYYTLSRAYAEGVKAFAGIEPLLIEGIGKLRQANGSYGDELLTGLAVCTLLNLNVDWEGMKPAIEFLIRTQRRDGSWRRSAEHAGNPNRTPFGSADLTTAICLEALARHGAEASARDSVPPEKQIGAAASRIGMT